jgi:hypothetical protein
MANLGPLAAQYIPWLDHIRHVGIVWISSVSAVTLKIEATILTDGLASQQCRATWATQSLIGVVICEFGPFRNELTLEKRHVCQRVETTVLVIGHDEHDIRLHGSIANSREGQVREEDYDGNHDGGNNDQDAAKQNWLPK